jgi:hypothetical protein
MKALHMITADPQRTPTLTMFAHPDYFLFASGAACDVTGAPPCITVPTALPTFAWNHGGIEPEIATTWVGYVGPGIRHRGQDDSTWTDHTDVRPTLLSLLGLSDTYELDGRLVTETLEPWAIPNAIQAHNQAWARLARTYKAITAPFGEFGQRTLGISTAAIRSGSSGDDSTYATLEDKLQSWTERRDALAGTMRSLLNASAFDDQAINQQEAIGLAADADALLREVRDVGS